MHRSRALVCARTRSVWCNRTGPDSVRTGQGRTAQPHGPGPQPTSAVVLCGARAIRTRARAWARSAGADRAACTAAGVRSPRVLPDIGRRRRQRPGQTDGPAGQQRTAGSATGPGAMGALTSRRRTLRRAIFTASRRQAAPRRRLRLACCCASGSPAVTASPGRPAPSCVLRARARRRTPVCARAPCAAPTFPAVSGTPGDTPGAPPASRRRTGRDLHGAGCARRRRPAL